VKIAVKYCLLFTVCLLLRQVATAANSGSAPLKRAEVLALVAGDALTENILLEAHKRGLAFYVTPEYRDLLHKAGADERLLSGLDHNKTAPLQSNEDKFDTELLVHLSRAGELIRKSTYPPAIDELNRALSTSIDGPEAPFVMGSLLRKQENWPKALAIYEELLRKFPDFPQIDTKLSYVYFRLNDQKEAIRHARAALDRYADDPEAHKFMGLALDADAKPDASTAEYREAIRLKPDYASAYYDLGIALEHKRSFEESVSAYRKAILLDPNHAEYHYNLGVALHKKGDNPGAVVEYRAAKLLDPNAANIRFNLANVLSDLDFNAAIGEYQELNALFPTAACHVCLGKVLLQVGKPDDAVREFVQASEIDPTDANAHVGLGLAFKKKDDLGGAQQQFERALQLAPQSAPAHDGLGNVFLDQKDFVRAVAELKLAEDLDPAYAGIHEHLAQALAGTQDTDRAITEYRQAILLGSRNPELKLKLAGLLEAKKDYVNALDFYRQAAEAGGNQKFRQQYEAARQRLGSQVQALPAIPPKPSSLPAPPAPTASGGLPPVQWKNAVDAARAAGRQRQWGQAEEQQKLAIEYAEKMQPQDFHLLASISELAGIYESQNKSAEAEAQYRRQLQVSQQLFGSDSMHNSMPLMALGQHFMRLKDYTSAAPYYKQSLELNEKLFSPSSPHVRESLLALGQLYATQKDYSAAEPYLQRALAIDQTAFAPDDIASSVTLERLAHLYKDWDKLDKAEGYARRLLAVQEKKFGTDSTFLCSSLELLADVLSGLGRDDEAAQLRKRQTVLLSQAK
jgi:tetratricopeptide (TPR) repeat protein